MDKLSIMFTCASKFLFFLIDQKYDLSREKSSTSFFDVKGRIRRVRILFEFVSAINQTGIPDNKKQQKKLNFCLFGNTSTAISNVADADFNAQFHYSEMAYTKKNAARMCKYHGVVSDDA